MSIWNKVLMGLIIVAALVFFYLAGRTLMTHEHWRTLSGRFEQRIEQVREESRRLVEGEQRPGQQAEMGIRQIELELHKLLLNRRRVWFKCDPKVTVRREEGAAEVSAAIDQPDPHGIVEKTILHAFEEAEAQKRGRYLGEFKVTQVDGKQATFVPTSAFSTRELDRLAVAKRPWTLYEILPRDDHEIFVGLSEAEKKEMLPADSLPEYVKDGQPAGKDDPPERLQNGKYVRPLRDYQILFDADIENRAVMAERFAAATGDKQLVDDALVQARQQEEACKTDVAAAQKEKANYDGQRRVVAELAAAIEKKLTEVQSAIADLLQKNQAMAGQIAKQQLEAARRIDERTRAMAQSGTGGR